MSLPVVAVALMVVLAAVLIRVVNWVWITPKKLERYLRRQGLHGTPYTPLVGDIKRNVKMLMEARSEPITLTDDIIPYLLPLALKMFNSHGRTFFMWTGPIPTIMITNPEHIKEVFSKTYDFEATVSSPLVKLLVGGLASYKGDKWARHRRIINPAFNLEKIKMSMIFYEVLRLYAPVSQLRREVNKEVKLGNVTLPAGVKVYIPTALIHRDPELWGEDAREFKPERFREGISKATKNQVCYSPFGWGLRICIGQNFSLLEAKMAMSLILLKFSFELSPSYVHSPQIVMTTRPQFGAHLILHKL